jgi:hypothetical protein
LRGWRSHCCIHLGIQLCISTKKWLVWYHYQYCNPRERNDLNGGIIELYYWSVRSQRLKGTSLCFYFSIEWMCMVIILARKHFVCIIISSQALVLALDILHWHCLYLLIFLI